MASPVGGSASAQRAGLCKGLPDIEDEDDLFEIDLDSVDNIPQTQYYWDSYFTETGNALLANCLLPVTDISRAIPMVSKALSSSEQTGDVAMIPQAVPLGQLLGLPFLEAFGLHQKEMKRMCDPVRKTGAHLDVGPEPLEGRYHFVYGR
ncbi:hypothetical protein D8674_009259 [Pyrus ussuriensis x Pyrus communis]|uniref:Uncharacterized protein n=1 Tax=Pyrus ussuriensis x Pyrus communis TaxID=2448454 RepID=A0A5N5I260_9ROSA|nr:hypothetical protein D8674_009259 [Pyrus ussuriensis x Pyrus communis]